MLGYPQTVFISWNYCINLLTFSFFPPDLSDASVMVLFGFLAFFLILSVVEVPCLLYLPRSCPPRFFPEFSSLIFPILPWKAVYLKDSFPFSPLWSIWSFLCGSTHVLSLYLCLTFTSLYSINVGLSLATSCPLLFLFHFSSLFSCLPCSLEPPLISAVSLSSSVFSPRMSHSYWGFCT